MLTLYNSDFHKLDENSVLSKLDDGNTVMTEGELIDG